MEIKKESSIEESVELIKLLSTRALNTKEWVCLSGTLRQTVKVCVSIMHVCVMCVCADPVVKIR